MCVYTCLEAILTPLKSKLGLHDLNAVTLKYLHMLVTLCSSNWMLEKLDTKAAFEEVLEKRHTRNTRNSPTFSQRLT